MLIGLFNPFKHNLREYEGYDITIFKNNFRIMEIIENRNGESGYMCPLYFDGAVTLFKELPLPQDADIPNWYNFLRHLRENRSVELDLAKRTRNNRNIQLSLFGYDSNHIKKKSKIQRILTKIKRILWLE